MEVLLDDKSSLEELFASLDLYSGFNDKKVAKKSDGIIPGFSYAMKIRNLPEQIIELFTKKTLVAEFNLIL